MSTVSLRVKLTRRCLLVPINGVIIFLICVVDFRRIEYRRSAYIFQRQRLGLTPQIAMVEPFLIRQSVGQQTEEVYRPLRQWPQTNEQTARGANRIVTERFGRNARRHRDKRRNKRQ